MNTAVKSRGRAYQCRRCGKTDRKGRIVGHVLKHHVPFDQVPYACSLCTFRCQDKQSLLDHIKKYSRHREEELKRAGIPDYTKILHKSTNPYFVGEKDFSQLSREDSLRWFRRSGDQEITADDLEAYLEDEEEDIVMSGGLALPSWMAGTQSEKSDMFNSPAYSPVLTEYQPFNHATAAPFAACAPVISSVGPAATPVSSHATAPFSACATVIPSVGHTAAPLSSLNSELFTASKLVVPSVDYTPTPLSVLSSEQFSLSTPVVPNVSYTSAPLTTFSAGDLHSIFGHPPTTTISTYERIPVTVSNTFGPPHSSTTSTIRHPPSSTSRLNTPVPEQKSPSYPPSTPCQDENILPGLVNVDHDDPLLKDDQESVAPEAKRTKTSHPTDEPPTTESPNTNTWSHVIMDAAKLIADAIHSNTRAVRCQEKTLEKVVGELARIERKICSFERNFKEMFPASKENLGNEEKSSRPKSMKSTVHLIKNKKN